MNKFKEQMENFAKDYQVSDDVRAKREEICNNCDKKSVKLGFDICLECGCVLHYKQRVKKAKCPLDLW